jgi:glyoxylase-like metal-dependent hydrolase (beta-lactamase superfamily II)
MSWVRPIDLLHLGRDRVICCYEEDGLLVDPGPTSCLDTLLGALDGRRPRGLLLTHIHLDHAGASGSLVEHFPDLPVYVHERGAPHLLDPSRLVASATRLYGDDMDRLWGEMKPVPEANLRILSGGEEIEGGWTVAYTPGHASHHVSYLHAGTAYVGDTGGVRIPPTNLTFPPTPPPDVDVDAWHASIQTIAGWRPERLAITHFGPFEDVEAQLEDLSRRLDAWVALVAEEDRDEFLARVDEETRRGSDDDLDTSASFAQAAPPEQLYDGLARYVSRKAAAG